MLDPWQHVSIQRSIAISPGLAGSALRFAIFEKFADNERVLVATKTAAADHKTFMRDHRFCV